MALKTPKMKETFKETAWTLEDSYLAHIQKLEASYKVLPTMLI
jgi:hypothetical protein